MRVFVTGCAGFIGYHLTVRLHEEGHDLVGMDDFSSGQRQNAADLTALPRVCFIEHDVCRPLPLDGPFDQVYNLACPASPLDFETKAIQILAVCSRGVENVLELARRCQARCLQASTSEVYGDPKVHPQPETYWGHVNPIGPRSCYDEGKRFAEALISAYQRQCGLKTRVARIFNTYGPRMRLDDGRALPNFICQALSGRPLTVHGDGSQTRSFCYVSDLVEGLILLMNSDVSDPVNLGSSAEVTMVDVARDVIRLCGSTSVIDYVPRPVDDPNIRRPDSTRALTQLGWRPKVQRSEGLARTVAWFQTQLARGQSAR